MAAYFKSVITICLASMLSGWMLLSWASDSSGSGGGSFTPYSGSMTPTVSANQPFLLDTGYSDVRTILGPWPAAGSYVAPGSVWGYTNQYWATAGAPTAFRVFNFTNPHLCPTNFNPVVTITPNKSLSQGNESMRACADSLGVAPQGDRYWFGVWVNTVTNTSGTTISGTSYYWSIFCYPNATYPTTSTPGPVDASTTGACSPANTTFAPIVLEWDKGYLKNPANLQWQSSSGLLGPGAGEYTLVTSRQCPSGYSPYATISFHANKSQRNAGYVDLNIINGICVNYLAPSGNGYAIWYAVERAVTPVWYSASSLTIADPYLDANLQGIEWTVYCYPPGINPPLNYLYNYDPNGSCNVGTAPY